MNDESRLMRILIDTELKSAFKRLAKWYKIVKELPDDGHEYYHAKEELEKAKANCLFWLKEEDNSYAMAG